MFKAVLKSFAFLQLKTIFWITFLIILRYRFHQRIFKILKYFNLHSGKLDIKYLFYSQLLRIPTLPDFHDREIVQNINFDDIYSTALSGKNIMTTPHWNLDSSVQDIYWWNMWIFWLNVYSWSEAQDNFALCLFMGKKQIWVTLSEWDTIVGAKRADSSISKIGNALSRTRRSSVFEELHLRENWNCGRKLLVNYRGARCLTHISL